MATASERAQRARSVILEALGELIASAPHVKPSVSAVLRRTGLGRNTFYGHFDDMKGALRALGEQTASLLSSSAEPPQGSTQTPYSAVSAFAQHWFGLVREEPGTLLVAFATNGDVVRGLLHDQLVRLHELGARAGVFRRVLEAERRAALLAVLGALSVDLARGQGNLESSVSVATEAIVALCR